jgi:hypothetical protein
MLYKEERQLIDRVQREEAEPTVKRTTVYKLKANQFITKNEVMNIGLPK